MEHLINRKSTSFPIPGKILRSFFPCYCTAFYFSYRSSTYICVFFRSGRKAFRLRNRLVLPACNACGYYAQTVLCNRRSVSGLDFSWKRDKFLCTFLLRISAPGRSGQLSSSFCSCGNCNSVLCGNRNGCRRLPSLLVAFS